MTDGGAVVFDFDGTLFRLPVDVAAVRRELAMADGEKLGDRLQRALDEHDDAALDVVTRHEIEATARGEFLPGALDWLARTGVAVVTRNSRHSVTAALAAAGLDATPPIVGREDVRRLKPDPEGLLLAVQAIGADPAATPLVGDTFHDVEAARAAGMPSIVVRNPLLAYAPKGADRYVDSLAELLGQRDGRPPAAGRAPLAHTE